MDESPLRPVLFVELDDDILTAAQTHVRTPRVTSVDTFGLAVSARSVERHMGSLIKSRKTPADESESTSRVSCESRMMSSSRRGALTVWFVFFVVDDMSHTAAHPVIPRTSSAATSSSSASDASFSSIARHMHV